MTGDQRLHSAITALSAMSRHTEVSLTRSMPTARNPPTPDAKEFAAWKIPILKARSEGLYQKLKYIIDVGTTPASGILG